MTALLTEVEEMADKKGKNVRAGETWLAVRLPEEAKARLEEVAARDDRSMSYTARRFVLEGLEREGRRSDDR